MRLKLKSFKLVALGLGFCFAFSVLNLFAGCNLFSSDSSSSDATYYEISSISELYAMESDKSYKLTQDIDLMGQSWTPLRVENFDGCGHTISNCMITESYRGYVGFFAYVDAIIENITLENISVVCSTEDDFAKVAILVGSAHSMSNCTVKNSSLVCLSKSSAYVGGVCGTSSATEDFINLSLESTEITFTSTSSSEYLYIGGIIGNFGASGYKLSYCTVNNSTITSDSGYTGGICGNCNNPSGAVEYCSVKNSTVSGDDYVGGLIAYVAEKRKENTTNTTISACFTENNVITAKGSGKVRVGGLFGISYGDVSNCYSTKNTISSTSTSVTSAYVGGFAASAMYSVSACFVLDCTITGNTSNSKYKVTGFCPNVQAAIMYCAVYKNILSGYGVDEFAPSNSFVFDCYVTEPISYDNENGLPALSETDWISTSIFDKLNLETSIWSYNSGSMPTITF